MLPSCARKPLDHLHTTDTDVPDRGLHQASATQDTNSSPQVAFDAPFQIQAQSNPTRTPAHKINPSSRRSGCDLMDLSRCHHIQIMLCMILNVDATLTRPSKSILNQLSILPLLQIQSFLNTQLVHFPPASPNQNPPILSRRSAVPCLFASSAANTGATPNSTSPIHSRLSVKFDTVGRLIGLVPRPAEQQIHRDIALTT